MQIFKVIEIFNLQKIQTLTLFFQKNGENTFIFTEKWLKYVNFSSKWRNVFFPQFWRSMWKYVLCESHKILTLAYCRQDILETRVPSLASLRQFLEMANPDLNCQDASGNSVLHKCIQSDNLDAMNELFDQHLDKLDLTLVNNNSQGLMHLCAEFDREDMVDALLKAARAKGMSKEDICRYCNQLPTCMSMPHWLSDKCMIRFPDCFWIPMTIRATHLYWSQHSWGQEWLLWLLSSSGKELTSTVSTIRGWGSCTFVPKMVWVLNKIRKEFNLI